MKEAFWLECTRPDRMWPVVASSASERKLRLAICAAHPLGLLERLGVETDPPLSDWEPRLLRVVEDFAERGRLTDEFLRLRTAYDEAISRFEAQEGFGSRDGDLSESSRLCRLIFAMADELPTAARDGAFRNSWNADDAHASDLFRDIFGNPFRPVIFSAEWRTSTVQALARSIHDERAFDRLTLLSDALRDAGCNDAAIHDHCCGGGRHVQGCWIVDLAVGLQ